MLRDPVLFGHIEVIWGHTDYEMGRRKKVQSPAKTKFTASEINKLKSKAKRKRIHFLQITLEIKVSRKSRGMSEGKGTSPIRRGVGEAMPSRARASGLGTEQGPAIKPGCNGGPSGGRCLKIPLLIFFLLIFFIFYFWTDSDKGI